MSRAIRPKEEKMEDKELIWVSKKLAEEFKSLDKVEEQEASVKRVIASKRLSLDEENELLSESLLEFKSVCLVHKKELQKVYEEQENALYKMWEDMGDISTKILEHSRKVASKTREATREIETMRTNIDALKKTLSGFEIYGADSLAKLAQNVSQMDENTKNILKFLLNNYTKEGE
jgi:hypothetical protein